MIFLLIFFQIFFWFFPLLFLQKFNNAVCEIFIICTQVASTEDTLLLAVSHCIIWGSPKKKLKLTKRFLCSDKRCDVRPPFHPSPKTSWGWFFISLEKSLTLNEQLTCRWEKRVWVSDWEGGNWNCICRKCQGFAAGKDVSIFVSLYLYFGNSAVRVIRQLSLQVAQEKRKRTRNKLCQPLRLAILEIHTRD